MKEGPPGSTRVSNRWHHRRPRVAQLYVVGSAQSSWPARECDCLAHRFGNAAGHPGRRNTEPTAAVIDPELMLSLPAPVTLQSGLDALSHALEAIWNVNANPVSDTFAVSAVHDIFDALPAISLNLRVLSRQFGRHHRHIHNSEMRHGAVGFRQCDCDRAIRRCHVRFQRRLSQRAIRPRQGYWR